jgi:hypothetical protein
MCQYGERVVGRLWEWHVSLIQEADRCRTMVETEVAKLKEKMESKAAEQCRIMVEHSQVSKNTSKSSILQGSSTSQVFFFFFFFFLIF